MFAVIPSELSLGAMPRLGDASAEFAGALGSPVRTAAFHGVVLRQYRLGGVLLTVLFDRDVCIAMHVPYTMRALHRADLEYASAALCPAGRCKLLIDDTGWIVAGPGCPLPLVDALVLMLDLDRPDRSDRRYVRG